MGGSTKIYDTTPKDTQKVRTGVVNYLTGSNGQTPSQVANRPRGFQPTQNPFSGMIPTTPMIGGTGVQMGGPQPNADPMSQGFPQSIDRGQPPPMSGGFPAQADPTMGGYRGFGVGNAQGGSPYDRIFATMPNAPNRIAVNQVGDVAGSNRGDIRDVGFNPVSFDPSGISRIGNNSINPNQVPMNNPANDPSVFGSTFNRGAIRDIGAQGTQSVDQLGGANSAFFQNMMNQLRPAFDQQRALAGASGKEMAGNLTGSGFANVLGGNLNRTLGDQQARLADYAAQGLQTEVGRQQGDANRSLQAGMANQGADQGFLQNLLQRGQLGLQGQIANQDVVRSILQGNQQIGLQGQLANQGVDQRSADQALNALLANQGAGIQTGGMNQAADINFQNADLQRRMANQGAAIGQNQFQGTLDQQRNMGIYQQLAQMGGQNAQNFLQLLMSQGTAGVSPNTIVSKPGLGQQLLSGGIQLGGAALAACWVADELYGKDDPRAHAARRWVSENDTPFTRIYKKVGRWWAALVRENPKVKMLIQPIWDEMAAKGAVA